jgi:coproporphyrinogen III oxidase-like Fe-S oxidoreductase
MLNTLFTNLVTSITRQEGKKFLKLNEHPDIPLIEEPTAIKNGATSLYIHIPFCRTLCPFCCFNRYLFDENKARRYFKDLKQELSLYAGYGFKFSDFYFGGGTPTILMDELTSLIDYLRINFDVKQLSLETTPREINGETIQQLMDMGINRLSIGVQSFDDNVIKAMGRVQCNSDESQQRILMAQGKFDTVNIDFVFNFPGQSTEIFEKDLQTFKKLGIDQATFYPLMPAPHKKDAMERKFSRVDNSRERSFYNIILKQLYDSGYKASTAWCFSRGDRMIDEYIIDFDDYIGTGAGSVSIYRGNFFVNTFSVDKYHNIISSGRLPIIGWRPLSNHEQMYYYLLTKLFGIRFNKDGFTRRFGADIDSKLFKEMLALKLFGIIRENEDIMVNREGMYTVSSMMRDFFSSLNSLREVYIEQQY